MSMRIVVWSASAVLVLIWLARRQLDDWWWAHFLRHHPYAKRPVLVPFPTWLFQNVSAVYAYIIQGFLIQSLLLCLWKLLQCGWHWSCNLARRVRPTPVDDRHDPAAGAATPAKKNHYLYYQDPHGAVDKDDDDDADSMQVLVHTPPPPPRPPAPPSASHSTAHYHATKRPSIALRPTVRFADLNKKDTNATEEDYVAGGAAGRPPSSVLRRRMADGSRQRGGPTKSVAFSNDATGAVKVTEHRYDPKPPVSTDKENSVSSSSSSRRAPLQHQQPLIATLGIHQSSHTLGHRQIVRHQQKNEMHLKRQEILSRKRSEPPADSEDGRGGMSAHARVNLARFKSRRPMELAAAAATQKRKDREQLQRELARFDDKRRRVNIGPGTAGAHSFRHGTPHDAAKTSTTTKSVSFATPPPAAAASATTKVDNVAVAVALTPAAGFSMARQATPHPNKDGAADTAATPGFTMLPTGQGTPHPNKDTTATMPGFSMPLQGTPQPKKDAAAPVAATPGFSMPIHGTPHPNKNGLADPTVSFGAVTSNVTTPEVLATTNAAVMTPVPFAVPKQQQQQVDTPHPNNNNDKGKSVSFADSSTRADMASSAPAVSFGKTAAASGTPASGVSFTTSAGPAMTQPSTPSFNFTNGSTSPPNTPMPTFGPAPVTTTVPVTNDQPTTALPAAFGTAPAPSFQFGSTAANTPKPGPVNGSTTPIVATTTPVAPTLTNVSFGNSTAVNNAPNNLSFANAPATGSFGSQFGSGVTATANASTAVATSNAFGTTIANAPTPAAAAGPSGSNPFAVANGSGTTTSTFGNGAAAAITAAATASFGAGIQSNASFGGNTGASFGGSNPPNPSFGGTQQVTTNGSNPFGTNTAPISFGGATQNGANQFGSGAAVSTASNPFAAPGATGPNPMGVSFGSSSAPAAQFGSATTGNNGSNTFGAPPVTATGPSPFSFGSIAATTQFGTVTTASNPSNAFGSSTMTGSNNPFGGGGAPVVAGSNNPFITSGASAAAGGFSVGSNGPPRGRPPPRRGGGLRR